MNEKENIGKKRCTTTKYPHNTEPEPPQWSQLPATIMVEIYKNLGDVDRVALARVCKTLYQVFRVSSLWRSRVINFGERQAEREIKGQNAIKFVKQFPTCLEDIEIRLQLDSELQSKQIVKDFKELAACFDDAKLRNISIISYYCSHSVSERKKKDVIESIKRLLLNQHAVRKFRTNSSSFDLESSLEILQCLAEASACTVQDLSLKDLFGDEVYMSRERRVLTELQKFIGLSRIHLGYNLFSEELAKSWVTGCPNLLFIGLCAFEYVHPSHVISCETWTSLVTTHPNLLVKLEAGEIPDANQLIDILSPAIPMFELSWYTFEDTRELELTRLLNRVAHYHRTIKHLCLRLSGRFPNLDSTAVHNMLSKCTNLLPFKCVNVWKRSAGENAWGLFQANSWLTENCI